MAEPNAGLIEIGPGLLYVAPIGTTEPTAVTGAMPAGWIQLGYTEAGSQLDYVVTAQEILVEELLDPIQFRIVKRVATVKFDLAEVSALHLQMAFNGGVAAIVPVAGIASPTIPTIGQETRVMLAWTSDDLTERYIYRRALQTGTVTLMHKKAPAKQLITCQFNLEIATPDPGDGYPILKPLLSGVRAA